ncbi:alpha/beta fold hydrolase [Rhizobium paknamense]|uniref:Pimeloyl-ACP methyl ester carboxylesterase n=1 Tax=Rhizobium paknamense TaxID=1206817 RepID=A0ABU0IIK6_9HYPH|nr:alpha/beta hydrolase [Rhizobium paknamense]MDQ0458089.1 pimeloyl-ACP methyl ester carboxylesterase [Rhizobium paknamense]
MTGTLVLILTCMLGALALGLLMFSCWFTHRVERDVPNIGERLDLGDLRLNVLHIPAGPKADLPPIVFIHGASGNLRDQAGAFRTDLEGRAELLFIDRPGHGYSDRGGPENAYPDGQARCLARAMERLGMDRALIVGHSFGGAIAASFAVLFPEKTLGLLFLAPATHPWPGGVDWHYRLARRPFLGRLFAHLIVPLAGWLKLDAATKAVFAPDDRPADYVATTGPALVLRPKTFRWNAEDISSLHEYVTAFSPRYREIKIPTIILSGTQDPIVLAEIHARGLERDIEHAELIWLEGRGHKPDYIEGKRAIRALERLTLKSEKSK